MTEIQFPDSYLPVNFEQIPEWLKRDAHWVIWGYGLRDGSTDKFTKPLLQASNPAYRASIKKPETWCDFATVEDSYTRYADSIINDRKVAGIGYVLSNPPPEEGEPPAPGLIGIDLDHASTSDGNPLEWSSPIIKTLLKAGAYVERSPSGEGYRAWVRGILPPGSNHKGNNVEIYNDVRYLTVTGQRICDHANLAEGGAVDKAVRLLLKHICGNEGSHREEREQLPLAQQEQQPRTQVQIHLDDAQVLNLLQKRAPEQWSLFSCGHPAGSDKSANDQSLCNKLAYYCAGDAAQVDRLMRQSALMADPERIKKWDSTRGNTTYGGLTIDTAISSLTDGGYKPHSRPSKREAIVLPLPPSEKGEQKPEIFYNPPPGALVDGWLTATADRLESLLRPYLYVRGEHIVALAHTTPTYEQLREAHNRKIPTGTLMTVPVDQHLLKRFADLYVSGRKHLRQGKETVPVYSCPSREVLETVLANVGGWSFRPLTGISHCPLFLFEKGEMKILSESGYSEDTGLYLNINAGEFSGIPLIPTGEELAAARATLLDVIKEFAFEDDVSRSVAVSMLLTPLVRPLIKKAPLFLTTSPTPGTGKSTLANVISVIATGNPDLNSITYTDNHAEFDKLLFAVFMSSSPLVVIDNIRTGSLLHDSTLERDITDATHQGRVLGETRTVVVSTRSMLIANGNNVRPSVDMVRRCLTCSIDRKMEHADEYQYSRDVVQFTKDHRAEIIRAGLTILAGYVSAGCPVPQGWKPFGSFENWETVRRATWWMMKEQVASEGKQISEADSIALFDPVESKRRADLSDPVAIERAEVLSAWAEAWGTQPMTAQKIVKDFFCPPTNQEERNAVLAARTAFETAVKASRDISVLQVSKWCRWNENVPAGGLVLKRAGSERRAVRWRIETAGS